ncbi:MAG: dipeptidase [Candidatus Cloacimonetes bacterium]|nr:dipeptidase [Candidatus Cloacimonadota bacterium]
MNKKLYEKAQTLSQKFIIVDTHIDIPARLSLEMEDISKGTAKGEFDYPRAKKGGLNAAFMAIYTPAEYEEKGGAKAYADSLIDMVEKFTMDWPDQFAIAKSITDIKAQFPKGLISLPMGMENGTPIERKLENLIHFYNRGIRYITLTHSKSNHICDSSFDKERKWKGLSPFGEEVVVEMNRLGIMIDITHVSDNAFYQVIKLTRAPVIASHSSCRHFTPGWERNMDDDMIQLLAKKGGTIQITFGSSFLDDEYRKRAEKARVEFSRYFKEHNMDRFSEEGEVFIKQYRKEHNWTYADITDVVAHIDHVVQLVGIDHVGLGSDFEGVGDSLPNGLKDVSYYPNLIYELLKKGYSEENIEKICSGNFFRVWSEVEKIPNRFV